MLENCGQPLISVWYGFAYNAIDITYLHSDSQAFLQLPEK